MKRLLYYNTSFDAELAGDTRSRIGRVTREVGVYSLLAADDDESVITDVFPDDLYGDRLSRHGFYISIASSGPHYDSCSAWGWSEKAAARLEEYGCIGDHPPFDIVKQVNGRAFGAGIARSMALPSAGIAAHTRDGIRRAVGQIKGRSLVKPIFGSSGLGHTVVNHIGDDEGLARADKTLESFPDGVTVEPLLDRIEDFAANFYLNKDGSISGLSYHKGIVDRRGMFRGIVLYPGSSSISGYLDDMEKGVESAAEALHSAGYFGDTGIDAFTYNDHGTIRLNPLCEINARRTMGDVARGCRRRLGGRYGCLRQFSYGCIPEEAGECELFFSPFQYDVRRKTGIFLASPASLRYEGVIMKPLLSLVYIAADSGDDLVRMIGHVEKMTSRKRGGR